ncbi:MAG: O-antigen ligase family protein [Phycisphaeraceae bacterium]
MKQLILLSGATLLGGLGSLQSPFWGLLLYYGFAVLRPQFIWDWALPDSIRWSLMAALIVLGSVVLHAPRIVFRGRMTLVLGLMLGFGGMLMLSVLTAYNPAVAQHWGGEQAKVLLIACLAALIIDRTWQIRLMGLMILVCLGYIAWEINLLYFLHGTINIHVRGYGGLDNNGAGLLLAMGAPFAYALAMGGDPKTRPWRIAVGGLTGAMLLHAVMMTYSRGAMLAAGMGMGWLILRHRPRWQAGAMAGLLLLGMTALMGPEIRSRLLSTLDYQQDASAQSRFDSWSAAWEMAWDEPLLGHGIRNANRFSANYGADRAGRTIHNQYLQIAADSGIPAAALYLALLGVGGWQLGRARKTCLETDCATDSGAREMEQTGAVLLACQASLLAFAVDGMFLSLDSFELPWLLLVLAGVAPAAVAARAGQLATAAAPESGESIEPDPSIPGLTPAATSAAR